MLSHDPHSMLAATASAPLTLVLAALLGGALTLGLMNWIFRRRNDAAATLDLRGIEVAVRGGGPRPSPAPGTPETDAADAAMRRICVDLGGWLDAIEGCRELWSAYDQIVRELLSEHWGATRVRCYHVRPGCETLQTIAQSAAGEVTTAPGPSLRSGILGHCATTGQEFVTHDPAHGPLVQNLADRDAQEWDWVWPVRQGRTTVGVVAAAHLPDVAVLRPEPRRAVGQLIALAWKHVAGLERLRVLERTDQATGVLTRNDFFTMARDALADSYRGHEPIVLAVLALEGLRRLDDQGQWQRRDALLERLGPMIARHVRSDDLVGRFADDRFAILLRRLDSGLGRLIAEKILETARQCVAQLDAAEAHVQVRVGLAGSGLRQPPLETLMVQAFEAVDRARHDNVSVASDLADPERGVGDGGHSTRALA